MKTIQLLFYILVTLIPFSFFSQKNDTAYFQGTDTVFAITNWDANKEILHLRRWYRNGALMDDVYCKIEKNQYVPVKNSIIYYSNGQVSNEFTVKNNGNNMSIINFDKNGNLLKKWLCDVSKNKVVETEYYLNGNKKTERISTLPDNFGIPYSGLWYGGNNPGTIYQRDKRAAYKIIEYHSNGKIMCTKDFKTSEKGLRFYEEKYFDTTGTIDNTTFYETINDPYRGTKKVKQGTWYTYYVNGQIKKKEHYKDGKREGAQRYWFENGQLEVFVIITNGKFTVVEKYDKDGKSLK